MSYESKIIIVDRRAYKMSESGNYYVYPEQLASVDMGEINHESWLELFATPIDYTLYIRSYDDAVDTDMYGDKMKYASIKAVKAWLEKQIQDGNDYRRLKPLLGLLNGFDESQWEELQVVHYGY